MTNYYDTDRSEDMSLEPIQCKPLEVKVINNFERAFKAFRALVQKERILSTYKERQTYEKPSDKRRRLQKESAQRRMELELKQKKYESGQFDKPKKKQNTDNKS